MKVKSKLKQILRERQLTQATFAAQAGLSQATIGKLCRDEPRRFDADTIAKVCEALGLRSISELIEIVD